MLSRGRRLPKLYIELFLKFLLIVIVPMAILVVVTFMYFIQYTTKNLEDSSLQRLKQTQNSFDFSMYNVEKIAEQILVSNKIKDFTFDMDPAEGWRVTQELVSYKMLNTALEEIILYYFNDEFLYSTRSSYKEDLFFKEGMRLSQCEDFKQLFSTVSHRSFLPSQKANGYILNSEKVIPFFMPLKTGTAKPFCNILFLISHQKLSASIRNTLNDYSNIYIAQNGRVFFKDGLLDAGDDVLTQMMASDEQIQYVKSGKKEFLVTKIKSSQVFSVDYYMVTSTNEYFQPLITARTTFLVVNISVLFTCMLLMLFLTNSIYDPIKNMIADISVFQEDGSLGKLCLKDTLAAFTQFSVESHELSLRFNTGIKLQEKAALIDFFKGRFQSREALYSFYPDTTLLFDKRYFSITYISVDHEYDFNRHLETVETFAHQCDFGKINIYNIEAITQSCILVAWFFDETAIFSNEIKKLYSLLCSTNFYGTLGVSSVFSSTEDAPKAMSEATTVIKSKCINEKSQLVFFSPSVELKMFYHDFPYKQLANFEESLHRNDMDTINHALTDLMDTIKEKNYSCAIVSNICNIVLHKIIVAYLQKDTELADLELLSQNINRINSLKAVENVFETFYSACKHLISLFDYVVAQQLSGKVQEILTEIEARCLNPNFSLYIVADKFGISPSQLSILFKSELDTSPSNYITKYKMQLAKKMLSTTNLKISVIAETLGFIDTTSFTRKFKKYTGDTPNEYRKKGTP